MGQTLRVNEELFTHSYTRKFEAKGDYSYFCFQLFFKNRQNVIKFRKIIPTSSNIAKSKNESTAV